MTIYKPTEYRQLRHEVDLAEIEVKSVPVSMPVERSAAETKYKLLKRDLEAMEADLEQVPPPLKWNKDGGPSAELAAIEARLEIIGDGKLTETYTGHRIELKRRAEIIKERMPYASMTDDDLTARIEDAAIAVETHGEEFAQAPSESARKAKAERLQKEAMEQRIMLERELAHRNTRLWAADQVNTYAENEAQRRAEEIHRRRTKAELDQLTQTNAPQWEIDKLKEESGGPPPPALVEEFTEGIKKDFVDAHPVLTDPV